MNVKRLQRYLHRIYLIGIGVFLMGVLLLFTPQVHAQTPVPTQANGNTQTVNSLFLWQVNPLTINENPNATQGFVQGVQNVNRFATPASFLNELFPYLFMIAGFVLFLMLLWAGGHMIVGGINDPKAFEIGRDRIGAAIIGFILLFITYWLAQILESIFGVNIVG